MAWSQVIVWILVVNIVSIVLEAGLAVYLFRIFRVLKGGAFTNAMRIIAIAPAFMILSAIGDTLSELGYGGGAFEFVHDLFRVAFVLLLFLGFRSMVVAWRKLTK